MKSLFVFLCITLVQAASQASECEELVVAGAEQWHPFAYTELAGTSNDLQAKGIAHDVIKMVTTELKLPLRQLAGIPWKRIELELEKGEIDVLAGNYWTEERAAKWLITDPIASESVNLFTLKGAEFDFMTLADLRGKRGVVPMGISLGKDFDQAREQLDILEVRTHEQMYEMLHLRRVDYLVSPRYAAQRHRQRVENSNVVMLPEAINRYSVHLSFSRQSKCAGLLQEFNRVIQQKRSDGSIDRVVQGYISTLGD